MGDKRVAVAVAGVGAGDDVGEGMQCSDHPYRSNPGGICAFCLQEKLGKLVSSSKSSPFFAPPPSTSSSSSPTSFPSDGLGFGFGAGAGGLAGSASSGTARAGAGGGSRTRVPFLAAAHKKKKSSSYVGSGSSRRVMASSTITSSSSFSAVNNLLTLKRSKSVAPRPVGGLSTEVGSGIADAVDSPRKKSFWSFLYLSSSSSTSTSSSSVNNNGSSSSSNSNRRRSTSSSSGGGRGDRGDGKQQQQQQRSTSDKALAKEEAKTPKRELGGGGGGGEEEVESPSGSQASSSFGRKVARSRSVGCGSRSFSGDFFERISTGLGDCTLRRVESHREAKPRLSLHVDDVDGEVDEQQRRFKERVKCGGFFGGFGMISSSSSYWLSADDFDGSRRISSAAAAAHGAAARGGTPHGRTWTWAWAFASPMRAFRPAPSSSKLSYPIKNGATAAATTNIITAMNASNNIINGAELPAAAAAATS